RAPRPRRGARAPRATRPASPPARPPGRSRSPPGRAPAREPGRGGGPPRGPREAVTRSPAASFRGGALVGGEGRAVTAQAEPRFPVRGPALARAPGVAPRRPPPGLRPVVLLPARPYELGRLEATEQRVARSARELRGAHDLEAVAVAVHQRLQHHRRV